MDDDDKFSQLMRNKTVHLLSLFLMVYIGVEVTIGGKFFFSFNFTFDCSYNLIYLLTINQDGL